MEWYAYRNAQLRNIDREVTAVWLESQLSDTKGQVGRMAQGIAKALLVMDYDTVAQLAELTQDDMRAAVHKVNPEASERVVAASLQAVRAVPAVSAYVEFSEMTHQQRWEVPSQSRPRAGMESMSPCGTIFDPKGGSQSPVETSENRKKPSGAEVVGQVGTDTGGTQPQPSQDEQTKRDESKVQDAKGQWRWSDNDVGKKAGAFASVPRSEVEQVDRPTPTVSAHDSMLEKQLESEERVHDANMNSQQHDADDRTTRSFSVATTINLGNGDSSSIGESGATFDPPLNQQGQGHTGLTPMEQATKAALEVASTCIPTRVTGR